MCLPLLPPPPLSHKVMSAPLGLRTLVIFLNWGAALIPCGVSCWQDLECMVSAVRGKHDRAPRNPKAPSLMMQIQPPTGYHSDIAVLLPAF
jgi:hypothetical protein